jgi:hypothetical protein
LVQQKLLTFDQKAQLFALSTKYLHQFELEGNTFLEQAVTCDEIWEHYITQESKLSSMDWHQKGPSPAISWQDRGKCVLGFKMSDSCLFSFA